MTAKFLYNHLTLSTSSREGFKSKEGDVGIDNSFGSGQGRGASGVHWNITKDALNKAPEKHIIKGCVIKYLITGETRSNNVIVFAADDLTRIAMSNMSLSTPSINLSKLTTITQLANDNLCAPGSFSIPKCSFRHLLSNNNSVLHDIVPITFNIQPTPTTEHQQIHQMPWLEPYCTLGVHLAPDRHPTVQCNNIIRQSNALGAAIATNPPNSQHLYTANTQYIQLSTTFALRSPNE